MRHCFFHLYNNSKKYILAVSHFEHASQFVAQHTASHIQFVYTYDTRFTVHRV